MHEAMSDRGWERVCCDKLMVEKLMKFYSSLQNFRFFEYFQSSIEISNFLQDETDFLNNQVLLLSSSSPDKNQPFPLTFFKLFLQSFAAKCKKIFAPVSKPFIKSNIRERQIFNEFLSCVARYFNFHKRYFTSRVTSINACASTHTRQTRKCMNKIFSGFFRSLISFKVIWCFQRLWLFIFRASLQFAQWWLKTLRLLFTLVNCLITFCVLFVSFFSSLVDHKTKVRLVESENICC